MRVRRTRLLRWLTIGTIAAVGAYFALDVVVLNYTESRGARELAQGLTGEEATADLGGIPFLPSFLSGRLTKVAARVRGATAPGGLRVASISASGTDVRFSPRRVFALVRSRFSDRTELRAAEAIVEVQLGEQDIEDFLQQKIVAEPEVRITPAGVEISFGPPGEDGDGDDGSRPERPSARYLPRVENGVLSLRLVSIARVPPRFREDALRISELISLPRFPEGLRADIRLGDGVIVTEASGRDIRVRIGEAGT